MKTLNVPFCKLSITDKCNRSKRLLLTPLILGALAAVIDTGAREGAEIHDAARKVKETSMNRKALIFAAVIFALPHFHGQSPVRIERLDGAVVSGAQLDDVLRRSLAIPGVAAVAAAIVQNGGIEYDRAVGTLQVGSKEKAGPGTVFRAASLSKPVFGYLVLKLADESLLDLDRPLCRYLNKPLSEYPDYADPAEDPRSQLITARMVLSHTTGFPNWRWQRPDKRLAITFDPGTRFSYSGEGYRYLQLVVENITGKGLEELARERVFVPLKMEHTSFLWQARFEGNAALDFNAIPREFQEKIRREANAAGSLLTTAADYARFLLAAMNGEGLRRKTRADMLKSQIAISSRALFGDQASRSFPDARGLAWALGWGVSRGVHGNAFFHIGMEPGFENYAAYFADRKTGYVLLSAGAEYAGLTRQTVPWLIGDTISPLDWMGY